jgi:hypothetical protein
MASRKLLDTLVTRADPRDRQIEAERAHARGRQLRQRRFVEGA